MKKELLFYDHIQPKQYLSILLHHYPYDIEASMVYSLCTKNVYPHPVLCSFISYYEDVTKIHITSNKQDTSSLTPLFSRMCELSQMDKGILHSYHFGFQAMYIIKQHSFSHPYAHLPLQKIVCVDKILLHDKVKLSMSSYQAFPIKKSSHFIFRDISIDALDYIAISIQITHKHGIIFLSKQCASLAIPLANMFHMITPCAHQDFLLIFGLADHINSMEYYVDETNNLYIGLVKGNEQLHHFLYLKDMILTLYNVLCMHQHDLPIHASMVELYYHNRQYGFLFAGETTTGKSEMLDALIKVCQQHSIACTALFDDHGTLHYLDNEMVTTAIELSACKQLSTQSYEDIFASFNEGILLEGEDKIYYQITPLVSFKDTLQFHKVTHLFYLDNTKKSREIKRLDALDVGLTLLQSGAYLDHHKKLTHHYFFNACGCVQEEAFIQDFVKEFITMFFVSNIPLYCLYTKDSTYQKRTLFKAFANIILEQLL